MKSGDLVKLIDIPPGLKDDEDLKTLSLFEKCLGKSFVIEGLETFEGLSHPLARLDVGHIVGKMSYMQTIYVEEEYLEIEETV